MFVQRHRRIQAWTCHLPIALVVGINGAACYADGTAASLSRGPYLQLATPESMVLVWRTEGPTDPIVRIGQSPGQLDREIDKGAITLRVSADVDAAADAPRLYQEPAEDRAKRDPRDADPSTSPCTYQYEAHIDRLEPGARYYYAVFDGKRRLAGGDEQHYFNASPPAGSKPKLRLWIVGDSGTAGRDQRQVYTAMQGFLHETGRPLDAYLHMGDMAYPDGNDEQFQRTFFDVYQPTLCNTVCWPTMGNHEGHTSRGMLGVGPYYDAYVVPTAGEAGGVASGSEAYYSFDIGAVHFICLDSHDLNREPTGAMAQWLAADLEQAQGDWLLAFFHHPPYTKGSHDSDREDQLVEMRTHIMPILESGGVDLVLAGHSHIYERSMLIDGAYSTPTTAHGVILDDGDGDPSGDGPYRKSQGLNPHEGTIAIVAGHGGAGLSRKGTMPIMRQIIVEHGSVILDVDGDTLTGTMINKEQVKRDLFSIVKRGKVTPTRVANPWQPKEQDPSTITEFTVAWDKDIVGQSPRGWRIPEGTHGRVRIQEQPQSRRREAYATASEEPFIALYRGFRGRLVQLEAQVEIPSDSAAAAGVVLAYESDGSYYAYRLDAKSGTAELVHFRDGREQVLTSKEIELPLDGVIKIELSPEGQVIEVQLEVDDHELEYAITLDQKLPKGWFGMYVAPSGSAKYRSFEVERDLP